MAKHDYVLITAARNEEAHIGRVLEAVVAQNVPPLRWVIVSDGSTDRTDEIVQEYVKKHPFIELLRSNGDEKRNFGSKALAIGAGVRQLARFDYGYLGILDADVSFSPSYYQGIMAKFQKDSSLGIAGGLRQELLGGTFRTMITPRNSVGGPIQFFRRQCFEEIGGYKPLKCGGIDAAAEISARMKGWRVQTYPDLEFFHHRSTGSADRTYIRTKFRNGKKNYLLGYHPAFLTLMVIKRMFRPGFSFLGGTIELMGYFWGLASREIRPVPDDFVMYLRSEQVYRMKKTLISGRDPANS